MEMSIQVLKKKESRTKQEEEVGSGWACIEGSKAFQKPSVYESLPRTLSHGWWAPLAVRESGEASVSTWHTDALNQVRFLVEGRKGKKHWARNQQCPPSYRKTKTQRCEGRNIPPSSQLVNDGAGIQILFFFTPKQMLFSTGLQSCNGRLILASYFNIQHEKTGTYYLLDTDTY